MRLLALHLERYGAFTGRSLAFRRDARLHVVLGANEAGKSTALAAVTDLLFGIEARTRYAFLHDMPEMRIGAAIEAVDGRRLAFRRRKGNRNTLVDGGDAALPEDALTPFLQGLTRPVFCRAFGLDAQALRAGGREMLDSEGEVGASLFAAASGLRGYRQVQASLEEEAMGIFAPRRAAGRSFYQALDRHDEARKTIRASELRAGDWRELNEEIEAAGRRLDEIHAERARIAGERARLERLRRVVPLIAGIGDALTQVEADAVPVEPGDAAIDRLGEALAALRAAGAEQERLEIMLEAAKADLDTLPSAPGLIARAEEILDGFRGIDRFDKDGADLPRVQNEVMRLSDDLDRLAVRVGLGNGSAFAERQPSDAERSRIEVLIREGRALAAELGQIERDRAAARAEHEGLTREEAEAGAPVDPAPLREASKTFAWLPAAVTECAGLDATIRRAEGVLRGKAARLMPRVDDTTALARLPLPDPAAIARFREAFDEADRDRILARQRMDRTRQAVAGTRERLRRREAGRPIASRADLDALRAERDARFAELREALSAGRRVPPGAVAAYERSLDVADRLADDLAMDAARVAEQAADRERLAAEEEEAATAAAALDAAEAARTERRAAWTALWHPVGIVPGMPVEMAAWLSTVETLIEEQGDLDERRIDVAMRGERIAAASSPLAELGRRAGIADSGGLDAGLLFDRVEERIAALAMRWEATREASARIRAAANSIGRLEQALAAARTRHSAWRCEWQAALPAIGLGSEARMEEAESALAAWREVPATLRERDAAQQRVHGMERDRRAYRSRIVRLVEEASDIDPASPSVAIRTLHGRLQAAQADEARRTELGLRLAKVERQVEAARRTREDAEGALVRLRAEIGVDPVEAALADTEALHGRLVDRRRSRTELNARRAELTRVSDGVAEATLRAELAATSIGTIDATLQDLRLADEDLDQRGKLAFSDRDRHERRRAELEGGVGAETAAAQKKAAEAEIAAQARQWAVLRFAGLMLSTAIGRHRAGQQDPLLTRAGALFSTLTGGAFSGLGQDYGEADEPRIVGRRAGGGAVPVEGLSEGTRDQLYLALRLAYLQDYAARAEPAPFVGDDLFSTFDDARTAHGLEALAAIGATIQPILFTHHRHVADLAASRLDEGVDIIAL